MGHRKARVRSSSPLSVSTISGAQLGSSPILDCYTCAHDQGKASSDSLLFLIQDDEPALEGFGPLLCPGVVSVGASGF